MRRVWKRRTSSLEYFTINNSPRILGELFIKEGMKMAKQQQVIMEDDYKSILDYETKTAQIITFKVLERPELSAWMILMPIVFIPVSYTHLRAHETSKGF